MQRRSKLFLAIAALLFFGWIGYLGFLVYATNRPVILSRPQILDAGAVVIAQIDQANGNPSAQIKVLEIERISPREMDLPWNDLAGQTITIDNLHDCRGWRGPGEYIVPLEISSKGAYHVFDLAARSPGYDPSVASPLVYVANEQTRRQLANIPHLPRQ